MQRRNNYSTPEYFYANPSSIDHRDLDNSSSLEGNWDSRSDQNRYFLPAIDE